MNLHEMLNDREALEGVAAWLNEEELTINIGQVQGDRDEYVESSAGWLMRLVTLAMNEEWRAAPLTDEQIYDYARTYDGSTNLIAKHKVLPILAGDEILKFARALKSAAPSTTHAPHPASQEDETYADRAAIRMRAMCIDYAKRHNDGDFDIAHGLNDIGLDDAIDGILPVGWTIEIRNQEQHPCFRLIGPTGADSHWYLMRPALLASGGPADETDSLPCPFCGSSDINDGEILTVFGAGSSAVQSVCNGCGAIGPEAKLNGDEVDYGDVKSIAAWNRRADTPIVDDFEKAFQLVFAAYNSPRDMFADDHEYIVSLRAKVTSAFSLMQGIRALKGGAA